MTENKTYRYVPIGEVDLKTLKDDKQYLIVNTDNVQTLQDGKFLKSVLPKAMDFITGILLQFPTPSVNKTEEQTKGCNDYKLILTVVANALKRFEGIAGYGNPEDATAVEGLMKVKQLCSKRISSLPSLPPTERSGEMELQNITQEHLDGLAKMFDDSSHGVHLDGDTVKFSLYYGDDLCTHEIVIDEWMPLDFYRYLNKFYKLNF